MMGCLSLLFIILSGVFFGANGWMAASTAASTALDTTPSAVTELTRYASIPQSRSEDGAFVLGLDDAPITLIEFQDFYCPHCQNLEPTIDQLVQTYVAAGAAQYEVRLIATAGGDSLLIASTLLECAEIQRPGAFWEGYLLSYELALENALPADPLSIYAERLNLDEGELANCSETARQIIVDDNLSTQLGVGGTPALFARYPDGSLEEVTSRDFDSLAQLIEAAKQRGNGSET